MGIQIYMIKSRKECSRQAPSIFEYSWYQLSSPRLIITPPRKLKKPDYIVKSIQLIYVWSADLLSHHH